MKTYSFGINFFILIVLNTTSLQYVGDNIVKGEDMVESNSSHHIEKKEAVLLGKEFLQEKGWEKDYFLDRYKAKLKNGTWHIVFLQRPKVKTLFRVAVSLRVEIDPRRGEVIRHVIQKGYFVH